MNRDNVDKFKTKQRVYKQLSQEISRWEQILKDSKYDKTGLQINHDNRFRSLQLSISIDSWAGVYGNSNCSRVFSLDNMGDTFTEAFYAVLEANLLRLLKETAARINKESEKFAADYIKYLDEAKAEVLASFAEE